jgi:hypothetical protein
VQASRTDGYVLHLLAPPRLRVYMSACLRLVWVDPSVTVEGEAGSGDGDVLRAA